MKGLDFSDISKLNERYARDPTSRIFVQLADAYRKNNMVDEALDVLNKGIEYHPQYALAYLVIGKCYYEKRAHVQAKDAFEKTIALDPQNIVALRMLAKTYEMLKDDKGQISAYKSIIAIDPLDNQAKERLAMLEALQRKEPLYTLAMAEEYEKQGNLDEALRIYENLLYTDPGDPILRQKTAELKKALEQRMKKATEEEVIDLQLERMFQPEELAAAPPASDVQEPAPPPVEPGPAAAEPTPGSEHPAEERTPVPGGAKPASAADEGIQRLEDFLAEELEHAASRHQTPPPDAEPGPAAIALPDEHGAQEETEPEAAAEETKDQAEPSVPSAGAPIYQEIDWEATLAPDTAAPPETAEDKPLDAAGRTGPSADQQSAADAARPESEPLDERAEPAAEQTAVPEPAEQGTEPEEQEHKDEPAPEKKTSEDELKSFQDWLSGLLK